MPRKRVSIIWEDFKGGLSVNNNVARNELSYIENAEVMEDGSIQKRPGVNDTGSDVGTATEGHLIWKWKQPDSSTVWTIVMDEDGRVDWSSDNIFDNAAVDLTNSVDIDASANNYNGARVAGAAFGGKFYITFRVPADSPQSFNGTSWTAITDNTLDADGGAEFPFAGYLLAKHERMFAANVYNGAVESSRIHWSQTGTAELWDATAWIDVDPDDGTEIEGLAPWADGILIFKERSIFFLSGVDEDTFTLYPIIKGVGTKGGYSIAVAEDRVFWYDAINKGVYEYDGANVNRIDTPVRNWLQGSLYPSSNGNTFKLDVDEYPWLVRGFYHNNRYYLSVRTIALAAGVITPNVTLVYNKSLSAWSGFWRVGWPGAVVDVDGVVNFFTYVGPEETVRTEIYELAGFIDDDEASTGINVDIETSFIAPDGSSGSPLKQYRFSGLEVTGITGDGVLTYTINVDGDNVPGFISGDLSQAAEIGLPGSYSDDVNAQWGYRIYQLAPTHESDETQGGVNTNFRTRWHVAATTDILKVKKFELFAKERGYRHNRYIGVRGVM